MRSPRGLAAIAGLALTFAVPAIPATAAPAPAVPPEALAARAADQAALSGADRLAKGAGEAFVRTGVTPGGGGLYYASYQRTYHGLPVVGGDAVVVADGAGRVRATEAAETAPITVGTHAALKAEQAAKIARGKVSTVDNTATPKLVVLAGDAPKLAYEVVVSGHNGATPTRLHVFVDSATGAVLDTRDDIHTLAKPGAATQGTAATPAVAGTGNSYYAGTVSIDTSGSAGSYSMTDLGRRGIACGREGGSIFTKSTNTWGNGSGTDLETGCVDALYSVQTEWKMLNDWLGRNGIDGAGGGFRASVGLNDVNAYWDGSSTHFGHSQDNQRQATPMDVVGHEFGHAIFQTTPGGTGSGNENGGLNESTGDIFGALTEFYANNPVDRPDFTVGEGVNLTGTGPIRYMYNPSQEGDPNCYSSSIPSTEVHAAAGPQNHWFYLLSQGSNASPASPTCNGSTVTGIGIQKAGKIFYNGLLKKTSSWNHKAARKATLEAAIALFPGSCTEFNATKAAWDAVSVTAAGGEPTCTGQPPAGNDYSLTLSPTSASVQPGQTATTTVTTRITSGNAQTVSLLATGLPDGAKATFNPASIQSGGTATLTITTSATTPQGTSQVTVTGDGTDADHTAQFSLTVGTGTPPTGCGGLTEWDSAKAYAPNDVVSHNGHKWTSLWYSTGAEPGAPTSWAVWSDGGAC
ncbi:M4 family metallopeptidase [Amycolatopsis australiensis]|uniref:Neutral metalloproteinase n=1 Tax=Amycolatopsis australiensis TaxID=546364 RepID=A0A1K1P4X8_9PSEU|nr:M4 family metallopeptidase [Amycolatopsis australiensis]SFW42509.1 Zn-dependent metalloprotease [Amycolatopsis australiensis]